VYKRQHTDRHTRSPVGPHGRSRAGAGKEGEPMSKLLMSRWFRRYVECLIVVWCPWVLLLEMDAKTMEEMDNLE